jgi:hypothetical protein
MFLLGETDGEGLFSPRAAELNRTRRASGPDGLLQIRSEHPAPATAARRTQ